MSAESLDCVISKGLTWLVTGREQAPVMMMDPSGIKETIEAGFTDQFVLFDKATELSSWNQLAPLSQNQLRTDEERVDESLTTWWPAQHA